MRDKHGKITTFDAGSDNTEPASINPKGEITGVYFDPSGLTTLGFVREKNGTITTFGVGPFETVAAGNNPRGEITGYYFGPDNLAHGIVRALDGHVVTFDVPGAGGPAFGDGTVPQSINPGGEIAGYYTDPVGSYHGFLRKPH